jgi:chitin synthase
MSNYNRLGSQGGADDPYEMDPRRPVGRTPSPGQPLRNYQLEDRYASSPGPLEIPMGPTATASGDRLPLQPSVRDMSRRETHLAHASRSADYGSTR